jgi:hypothetical protein
MLLLLTEDLNALKIVREISFYCPDKKTSDQYAAQRQRNN